VVEVEGPRPPVRMPMLPVLVVLGTVASSLLLSRVFAAFLEEVGTTAAAPAVDDWF
jgi:hypothetical protein